MTARRAANSARVTWAATALSIAARPAALASRNGTRFPTSHDLRSDRQYRFDVTAPRQMHRLRLTDRSGVAHLAARHPAGSLFLGRRDLFVSGAPSSGASFRGWGHLDLLAELPAQGDHR